MIERPRLGWDAIGREDASRAVTQYRLNRLHFQYKGDLVDRGAEVAEAHLAEGRWFVEPRDGIPLPIDSSAPILSSR